MNERAGGVVPKYFKLPEPMVTRLAEESARTRRPEVRIVERALEQFFTLTPDERERFGVAQAAEGQ